MNKLLKTSEYVVSKLSYPRIAVTAANSLIERQNLDFREGASISRNCKLRGNVTLGPESSLSEGCKLFGDIEIGKRTNLNEDIEIVGEVEIGKYCALARDLLFQEKNHETSKPAMQMRFYNTVLDSKLEHTSSGPITVGNDVWIGARATILSGVTIGDGAVVGAGSIVTEDVEPYSVVAGVPARRVKWRFPENIRTKLLNLAWWDWSDEKLREHREFFDSTIDSVSDIPDI